MENDNTKQETIKPSVFLHLPSQFDASDFEYDEDNGKDSYCSLLVDRISLTQDETDDKGNVITDDDGNPLGLEVLESPCFIVERWRDDAWVAKNGDFVLIRKTFYSISVVSDGWVSVILDDEPASSLKTCYNKACKALIDFVNLQYSTECNVDYD